MKSYRLTALFLIFLLGCSISMSAVTYCTSSAVGYGSSATGGGSATPVLVSSVSQLQSALNKGKNKVIIITADLTFTSMLSVQDGSNVTLMALPGVKLISLQQDKSSSGILYIKRFSNLIIRNLTFVGPGAYDCDGNDLLCLQDVTNAWVDHCDFQDGCDGNFDNKNGTDNVTVSWCRFRYLKAPRSGGSGGTDDHRFTNLLGSSSSDKPSDGTYNMTWAYCWWDDGCKERMLRCRNASLHFLNCYWNSSVANYYIGPENADCYIEGCTFEGAPKTAKIFYQNYGGKNGSKFINCTATKGLPGNVSDRTVVTPSYSYTALTAAEAKTAVTNATCGAGATLTVTTAGAVSSTCDGGAPAPTVYTVTWNATTNGGSCGTATTMVTSGNAVGSLPEATKDGFSFDGWYTLSTGGTKISASTTVTENKTYYAQFTSAPVTTYYTVIWDANGGTCGTASTSVESGNAISTAIDPLPTATKAGDYSFDGWYTATSGGTKITTSTVINANVTYYAHYTSTGGGGSCTGTIYSAYTSATGNISIAAGASNLALNTSTHNTTVTGGSMSVYNGQSSAKNLITSSGYCMTNNNTYFRIDLDCPLQSGDAISVDVGKDGSNERGVWISTATTRPGSAPACALTATNASLVPVTYTVTGTDAYHGESTFYIYRATANSTYFNNINITRAGAALPANFVLSYDENGGSGTMADTEQTGANVTVAANAFTAPTGYGFLKWNTAMNGSGTDHAASDVITLTEDMTLYAIWTPQSYTVTLNAEGGSDGTANVSATYDEAMPSIKVPTKAGYVFSGYFTGTNGTGTQYYDGNGSSTNSWDIAADTELHAYWVEGSSAPTAGCDLHFWFFKAADATANGKTNDATVFSAMVGDGSNMSGSITIDGTSYSVTRRTGDNATFGSFTIPAGKTGTFYALAVSSGGGDRQINLVGPSTYELPVAGGSDSYKRIESEELPAGTYSIERDGTSNVRLGIVVVKICGAVTCDADPAAPSGLTAGSITSAGVTLTITDDATPTSYDIYYSTESTTPTSGTEATTTTTGKTKVITGLTLGTTYYAWARAVCDASHKSAWVALTGSTFATSKMVPTSYTVGASAEGECTGGMTAKITLSGSQIGVDYQLKNNGANDGAAKAGTGSALEWTGKSSGVYTVWAVENATYSALQMSKTATIVVYATTAINTQPATTVAAEADESFTLGTGMVAAGNELAYRWYTCGSTGTDTVFISGATSATYTTSQAIAGTYYYRVRVEGTCGDPVLSNLITVTVGPTGPYWALRGEFDSWSTDGTAMTETAGVASVTMSLAANTRYEFKFKYGSDQYGNTGAIVTDVSGWTFATDKDNCTLYTGPAGDYTFSINTSTHEASVTYPVVSHPCENYVYFVKPGDWNAVRIYNYTSDVSRMSDWEGSPTITNTTTICEQEYYYCAAYPSFDNIKWRDNASHESTALSTSAGLGKYFNFAVSTTEWQTFATYTISFNAGTGTGTMDPITGICPNGSQEISVNSFAKAGYTFANWIADVATKVGGSDIAAGSAIAGGATLQNIYHDITLTAQWTPNNYTIDLDNQSATGTGTANVAVTYNANTNLLVPIACPHKTGYYFDGYYTETNGGGVQLIDRSGNFIASQTGYTDASRNWVHAGNVTLYAKWTELTVNLTISPTLIAPSTATNVTYTITTNAPTGTTIPYSFAIFNFGTSEYAGGYLDGAHDINSGLSTTVSMNMAEGTWYTRAVIVWNGSELATSDKTMLQVGSLYTVTYDANSGTVSPASRTQASIGASITLDTPTRTDYTFLGWYVGATKIGEGGDSYVPTADVTAIAAWKQDCVGGGGSTTLFNVDFTDETTEQIRATTSGASWVAKTYDTYSMSFGSKDADAGVIDIINGTGLRFTGNNMNSYNCLAIPLTLAKDEQVTAVVTLGDATKIKYNWVSGAMPATPNNGSSGSTYGTNSTTNTLEYTPTTAGDYVLYLGRSGSSSGKIVESIVITQGGAGGTCYYVTYDGNGADGGYTNDPTAYDENDEVTVLANGFTKTGVAFKGWAANTTNRDAGTVDYLPGVTFTITANTTLYAVWGAACATTPDAPTSPTNGATTQSTQEVSWTDAGNSQWEVYVSTSGSTPATDQTPTEQLIATSYTFTGLTPSTPYYWWVRSVCDASHKSAWVAGPNFTTAAELPEPTFTWLYDATMSAGGIYPINVNTTGDADVTLSIVSAVAGVSFTSLAGKPATGSVSLSSNPKESTLTLRATSEATVNFKSHTEEKTVTITICETPYNLAYGIGNTDAGGKAKPRYYHETTGIGRIMKDRGTSSISVTADTYPGEAWVEKYCKSSAHSIQAYTADVFKIVLYVYAESNTTTINKLEYSDNYMGSDGEGSNILSSSTIIYNDNPSQASLTKNQYETVTIILPSSMAINGCIYFSFTSSTRVYGAKLYRAEGSNPTSVAFSGSSEVNKYVGDPSFTQVATQTTAGIPSNGVITYSSEDETVATVDLNTGEVSIHALGRTRIIATLSSCGCFKSSNALYTLIVKPCTDPECTISVTSGDAKKCAGASVTLTADAAAGASLQWYKDDVALIGETNAALTTTEPGIYYATARKGCLQTSNSIRVTNLEAPTAEALHEYYYVKSGRVTPDIPLFKVTNTSSFTMSHPAPTGCTYELREDDIVYLTGVPATGLSATNYTLTITAENPCGGGDANASMTFYVLAQTAKPTIAWIGYKGSGANQQALPGTLDASQSTTHPLYIYLQTFFDLTPVNAYCTIDTKKISDYYSQFDLVLLTDYPDSHVCPTGDIDPDTGEKYKKTDANSYSNAIGSLIDEKPILTFEAFVAGLPNWGIHTKPGPNSPTEKEITLLCAAHNIFDHTIPIDEKILFVETSSGSGLQGFAGLEAPPGMIYIATISDGSGGTRIACCERQTVIPARMMIMGLNHDAMQDVTTDGKIIIKQIIEYLLQTTNIADCALIFDNQTGDHKWSTPGNWAPAHNAVPKPFQAVRIEEDCEVDVTNAHCSSVRLMKGIYLGENYDAHLTILPTGGLTVTDYIKEVHDANFMTTYPISSGDLLIRSTSEGNGALVFGDESSDLAATVEYYSKAYGSNVANPVWQYIGIPISDRPMAIDAYYQAWMCSWENEGNVSSNWRWVENEDRIAPFKGYCITQEAVKTYTHVGILSKPEEKNLNLRYFTSPDGDGFNMFANSWVAPIDITKMETEDFGGSAEPTIFIYNTGSRAEYEDGGDPSTAGTNVGAGQFNAIPVNAAEYLSGSLKKIPSMQGFFVQATKNGTLTLNYEKLCFNTPAFDTSTDPTRAPKRVAKESEEINIIPEVMRLDVTSTKWGDRVYILTHEEFSEAFNLGWDGTKQEGDKVAPMLSMPTEAGEMAVAAVESADGRYLSFRAGEDSVYTFSFNYAGETLYLYDQLTEIATEIRTGNTYTFEATNETPFHRFLITSTPPKTPTDIESLESESLKLRGAEKFIQDDKLFILYKGVVYDARGARITGRKEAAQ